MRAHEGRHTDIYSVKLPMMGAEFFALEDRDNTKYILYLERQLGMWPLVKATGDD